MLSKHKDDLSRSASAILKIDEHPQILSLIRKVVRAVIREELSAVAGASRAEWLTTEQAANLLQICPTSLEKARSLGRGPLASVPYLKIGRSVRYARADVVTALERLRVPGRALKS